jgi:hypothetical protein
VDKGAMQIKQRGKPKFVGAVDEITLSGAEALRQGKQIYFVTQVGVMQLTAQGLTLMEVMPGIDITRDILSNQAPRIVLPEHSGVPDGGRPRRHRRGLRAGVSNNPGFGENAASPTLPSPAPVSFVTISQLSDRSSPIQPSGDAGVLLRYHKPQGK